MFDDGTNGDLVANDGVYSAILPFQSSGLDIKFYILSENNDAIKLSPQRAEYEFYIYSPISYTTDIITDKKRNLVGIKDALGKSVKEIKNTTLFYIYDNGTVEKKFIVE